MLLGEKSAVLRNDFFFVCLLLHIQHLILPKHVNDRYFKIRPVSKVVLLPCRTGSTVVRLQHDISTTWFQTSNLIYSNRTAVTEVSNVALLPC